jgi:hypothetical protein
VAEPAIMDQALETLDNVLQISAQVQQIAGMIQVRAPPDGCDRNPGKETICLIWHDVTYFFRVIDYNVRTQNLARQKPY